MQTSHDPPTLSCACFCNNECFPLSSLFPILEKRCRGLVSVPRCVSLPEVGFGLARSGAGVQGWKMNCLRPAPPTRSFFQADKRNTLRRKGS